MTDTEILDYLQESVTHRRRNRVPMDVELGSVVITLGLRPRTLRELLIAAIGEDQVRQVRQVTGELRGS